MNFEISVLQFCLEQKLKYRNPQLIQPWNE